MSERTPIAEIHRVGNRAFSALRDGTGRGMGSARLLQEALMKVGTAKASLRIIRGRLRQKWARLTGNDSGYAKGKVDELYGRIEKRASVQDRGRTRSGVRRDACRGGKPWREDEESR